MLLGNDFVKAEHKYRMELLRYQQEHPSGRLAKTAGAVVVAALVSVALAACGVPVESDAGLVTHDRLVRDHAPTWQPNDRLLQDVLRSYRGTTEVTIPAIEFGGRAPPGWEPNYDRLETLHRAEPNSGPR